MTHMNRAALTSQSLQIAWIQLVHLSTSPFLRGLYSEQSLDRVALIKPGLFQKLGIRL
jgi:hypothetical protein